MMKNELGERVFLRHAPLYRTVKVLVEPLEEEGVRSGTKVRLSLLFQPIMDKSEGKACIRVYWCIRHISEIH